MLERFLARYGLAAVPVGTSFEGETTLVLAGFAAHRGYLELPEVMPAAVPGTLLGDHFWFWLGRWGGARVLEVPPTWRLRAERAHDWIARHERSVS